MNESSVDDIERRDWNRQFAAEYVKALFLVGEDAATLEAEVVEKLDRDELLNDAALVKRARRMLIDKDLRARGFTQEQIDEVRLQLYGTFAYDTYRGQISRLLELVGKGDDSARQRVGDQLNDAERDPEVTPEQFDALKRLVRGTLGE